MLCFIFILYDSLQCLESGEGDHPVTVGLTPANKPLNRFNNIAVCESKAIIMCTHIRIHELEELGNVNFVFTAVYISPS